MVFTLASLLIRFLAGKASDRYGRVNVIKTGLLLMAFALCFTANAQTSFGLLLAAGAIGVATGVLSPAVNAWTIDLSFPEHRGKAMATMYIALEAGIGLGALLAGWYYQDVIARIPQVIYISSGVVLLALGYLLLRKKPAATDDSAA